MFLNTTPQSVLLGTQQFLDMRIPTRAHATWEQVPSYTQVYPPMYDAIAYKHLLYVMSHVHIARRRRYPILVTADEPIQSIFTKAEHSGVGLKTFVVDKGFQLFWRIAIQLDLRPIMILQYQVELKMSATRLIPF